MRVSTNPPSHSNGVAVCDDILGKLDDIRNKCVLSPALLEFRLKEIRGKIQLYTLPYPETSLTKVNRCISRYNQILSQMHAVQEFLPFINVHNRSKKPSSVQKKLDENIDTLIGMELEPGEKLHVLCSKGRYGKKELCWASSTNTIEMLLKDTSLNKYELMEHRSIRDNLLLTTQIGYKCPSLIGDDSKQCGRLIPVEKMMVHLPRKDRNEIRVELKKIYMELYRRKHPERFTYCINKECRRSEIGTIKKIDRCSTDHIDDIMCMHCNENHSVHYHKHVCEDCNISFCNICKESPYHEGKICQGEILDIDEETRDKIKNGELKRCPSCKILSEKVDGCDKMTCTCGIYWCWRCQQQLRDGHAGQAAYLHRCVGNELEGRPDTVYHDDEQILMF